MADDPLAPLHPEQRRFVERFAERDDPRSLLVAAPGLGKSTVALFAARKLFDDGKVDRVLMVGGTRASTEQWSYYFVQGALAEDTSPRPPQASRAITYSRLAHDPDAVWNTASAGTRWLIIFDDVGWLDKHAEPLAASVLARFPGSRVLFVADAAPSLEVDVRFAFGMEFFTAEVLAKPAARSSLLALSLSIGLIERVQRRLIGIDELSWRDLEELVARMLESDGYDVELTRGTKDGGVDVIATKDLGEAGLIKAIWQAKRNRADRKVGLSLVRELADTRMEVGASKAVIVTTSYLTCGALKRVERDRYLLGKVDRDDLDRWIDRTLRSE
jgi:restriction system protein